MWTETQPWQIYLLDEQTSIPGAPCVHRGRCADGTPSEVPWTNVILIPAPEISLQGEILELNLKSKSSSKVKMLRCLDVSYMTVPSLL
jgi:hypothetical protein